MKEWERFYIHSAHPALEKLSPQVAPQVAMQVAMQVTMQVTMQVEELIKIITGEQSRQDLQTKLNLTNRDNFRKNYLQPALDEELIELTIPDKPNSSKQKYRLTTKGILMKDQLSTTTNSQ